MRRSGTTSPPAEGGSLGSSASEADAIRAELAKANRLHLEALCQLDRLTGAEVSGVNLASALAFELIQALNSAYIESVFGEAA